MIFIFLPNVFKEKQSSTLYNSTFHYFFSLSFFQPKFSNFLPGALLPTKLDAMMKRVEFLNVSSFKIKIFTKYTSYKWNTESYNYTYTNKYF